MEQTLGSCVWTRIHCGHQLRQRTMPRMLPGVTCSGHPIVTAGALRGASLRRREHRERLLQGVAVSITPRRSRRRRSSLFTTLALASSGGGGGPQRDADLEFSVFRFTLGIPGFGDENIPLVVGILGAALLAANRAATPGSVSPGQTRTEVLGALLAVATSLLPWIGSRLKGAKRATASSAGAVPQDMVFALADRLEDRQKKDVAWATYSLLRNTNTSAVLLWAPGEVICARGRWGPLLRKRRAMPQTATSAPTPSPQVAGSGSPDARLVQLALAMEETLEQVKELQEVASSKRPSLTVVRRAGLQGLSPWPVLPDEALTVLALPLRLSLQTEGGPSQVGLLLLLSDVGDAYSAKDRAWAGALAKKLSDVC